MMGKRNATEASVNFARSPDADEVIQNEPKSYEEYTQNSERFDKNLPRRL